MQVPQPGIEYKYVLCVMCVYMQEQSAHSYIATVSFFMCISYNKMYFDQCCCL